MVSSNDWTPVTILHRKHLGLLALLPFLLWSCQAEDLTAHGAMTEPGVLASGYWIPDGIAVIGEGEFLFADRGGPLYHYVGNALLRLARHYPCLLRVHRRDVAQVTGHAQLLAVLHRHAGRRHRHYRRPPDDCHWEDDLEIIYRRRD